MERRFAVWFTSMLVIGCSEATPIDMVDDTPRPGQQQGDSGLFVDTGVDGGGADGQTPSEAAVAPEAGDDGGTPLPGDLDLRCREGLQRLETFLSSRRSCERHEDCAIIGGCSGSIGFAAVRADARDEAQRMAEGICGYNDGPLYSASCEQNRCVTRRSGGVCGSAPGTGSCRDGQALYALRCDGSEMQKSCESACDGPSDARCPTGYSCQQTPVYDQGCTAAASQLFLCRPTPACEVALSLELEGSYYTRATKVAISALAPAKSLKIWAENLTAETKSIRYRPPCPAPARLTGLGEYDPFGTCLAGACPEAAMRDVVLEPGARVSLGTAQVSAQPGDCGPGLPRGFYDIGLALPELSGAAACGPAPFQLLVQ